MRGAERRQALVRIPRTPGPPRGRAHLGIPRDAPAHDADRGRLSALCCGVLPYGVGPCFSRLLGTFVIGLKVCLPGENLRQTRSCRAASVSQLLAGGYRPRTEPRRRPCAGCEPNHPGAAPIEGPDFPGARPPDLRTCSPVPPPACSAITTPHESAPR